MPVTGRKPKPAGESRHRGKPTYDWTEVVNVPFVDGPKLPRTRANGQPWMARTKKKWAAWAAMPHCTLWGDAEWDFALDAIELAAQFHAGNEKVATELRNREKVLGTTHDYRRDLRIRYVEPEPENETPASVTKMDDYRDL